jgi:hypothetical protein
MPARTKLATIPLSAIEPELKEFIDDVLVPMLVRDAVRELSAEIQLAHACASDRESARSQDKL